MEPSRAAQALAEASSSLVRPVDAAGSLTSLLASCRRGLEIDAGGILVESRGGLELLASTSHAATELEMHQLHLNEGPCFEAHRDGASLQLHSPRALLERWPEFGRKMLDAGFHSVHATPLVWQGDVFGAMGLFRHADDAFSDSEDTVAHAFADIGTALLAHTRQLDPAELKTQLAEALQSRVVVEQAKGVLSDQHSLSMAEAYELLVQSALDRH